MKTCLKLVIPRVKFIRYNDHFYFGYTKNRLLKLQEMNKSMFNFHLKECEFILNNRKQKINKNFAYYVQKKPFKMSSSFIY